MTFIERRFFKKVNRNIYIAVFCMAALFFWYNAGNKTMAADNIRDIAVKIDSESDAAVESDTKSFVTSDVGEENDSDAEGADDTQDEEQTTVNPLYADMFIVNVSDYLNIRAEADENSDIVGKLYAGSGGDVLQNGDEWTLIQSGAVEGYVKTEYIILGTDSTDEIEAAIVGIAVVNTDTLRVRAEASTDADIVTMVAQGTELTCTSSDSSDEWIGVEVDGAKGYVSAEYVTVTYKLASAVSIEEERAAQAAAEAAKAEAESQKETEAASQADTETASVKTDTETTAAVQTSQKATEAATESTAVSNTKASVDSAYLLACLVYCEAGSESYEGKLAVANVVLNRLNAGWGSSISDVIYASGQFSPATNGALDRAISSGPNSDSTKAANAALAGTNNVSGYYHFGAVSAIDCDSLSDYIIIGNHVFY